MIPMAHPLPALRPVSRPPTINHFCPHLQIETVGVLRPNGQYYHYCFDYTSKQFQALECLGCQPETTERDLFPMYAEYCKKLDAHVCFAFNNLSWKVEQFVFQQNTGGFEEVFQPEMVPDFRKPLADILCVVEKTNEYGMTIIQRDVARNFKKSRAYNGEYIGLPPVRVKTLLVENYGDVPLTPMDVKEFRTPFPCPKNQFNIFFHGCPRYPGAVIVCIRQGDQSVLRFYFSLLSGDFVRVVCPECSGPVTENFLRPLYAARSEALGEHLLFMENTLNFCVEQYVLCKETGGFKQVVDKDLVFDQKLKDFNPVILKVETDRGLVQLCRNPDGFIEKIIFVANEGHRKIAPSEVKTLAVQKREAEIQRLFSTAMAQQLLLMTLNVPVPVTVTPESDSGSDSEPSDEFDSGSEDSEEDSELDDESDSEESDSEESETDSESESVENEGTLEMDQNPEERPLSALILEIDNLKKALSELDVSKHQEQPPSEVFTHGYMVPTRAISPEESDSGESETDSNYSKDFTSGSVSPIQKETEAEPAPRMPSGRDLVVEYKQYIHMTQNLPIFNVHNMLAPIVIPKSESNADAQPDSGSRSGAGAESLADEGTGTEIPESGADNDTVSSDGSFEKIDTEAGDESDDGEYSDIEDYDTCDDQ